ncbi:MAG: PAS domain S-box protein [Bacteroidia bacterium]|nr:PAS domain S-box protein [Bacteroidia bacterium]MCX7763926.1 PAS domain S-box protein [Bacteroidia bacterium]MDW8057207.1 PAS domain S-box protein [Bacteroidia bacterium]
MRRWGIAEYIGVGLALLVGLVGLFLLVGMWIIAQRDMALAEGLGEWEKWDKWLSVWAYTVLLSLLVVAVVLALWWWSRIGRSFLRVRDKLRGLLWEGIRPHGSPSGTLPAEVAEVDEATNALDEALGFLESVAQGLRYTAPPQIADWPPALRQTISGILEQIRETRHASLLRHSILNNAIEFVRLGQQSASVEAYLSKAGPIFLQSIGATLGAFYRVEGERLRRLYSYAYPADAPQTFALGEGWIGQVAREGQSLWLSTLPQGYLQALSGLGKAPPQSIAVLPVIAGNSIYGVWDVAAFTEWDEDQRLTAEALLPFFAVGYLLREEAEQEQQAAQKYATLQSRVDTLLQESDQLRSQVAQLHQVVSSLEKQIQDERARTQQSERQVHSLQHRWNTVVKLLREAIVFFDVTGRPRYLSPAVSDLLGYSEEELQVFFRPVERADAEVVREHFQALLSPSADGIPRVFRFRYYHKDGRMLWLEAIGTNYLSHPGIESVLMILRDVTEEMEYEKQYRTRLKFQSLVENSPDIIFRTDREGRFLYVNPTIERYTGYSPAHYIRNTIYSVGFSLEEVQFWSDFIQKLFDTMTVQSAEIEFPSVYGTRKMAVRGIPEVGPEGEVETMVVLLQDITELRQVQEQLHLQNLRLEQARRTLEAQKEELEEKNRDIMESITYARRIQSSILPGEEALRELFPDSFILHWLRDVVGGDFYWCGEVQGHKIVAVVDCTGHGVPGAFMTFLGYTLLESAIRERGLLDPAQILYYMDGRLRELLSGQEVTQDGMEMVLCVIDPHRRIVRFAGAHRPLLIHQQGRWNLLSGAPTGLGGAPWLDKVKNFVTHTFSYQPGDALYLYTDGYADQFSADGYKRYTHRRFREFLAMWGHLPMADQHQKLLEELRGWMGENSPTDDITVMGLRL